MGCLKFLLIIQNISFAKSTPLYLGGPLYQFSISPKVLCLTCTSAVPSASLLLQQIANQSLVFTHMSKSCQALIMCRLMTGQIKYQTEG